MSPSDSFEVDRGSGGRIKVNLVSLANLGALIALIGTAVATWNGLANKVDVLSIRVQNATETAGQIRLDLNSSINARDIATRDLSNKVEIIGNRMTAVETILQRVERKIETK